jgi:hypothetical protein
MPNRSLLTTDEIQTILQKLETRVESLRQKWDAENPPGSVWWSIHRTRLMKATSFLIGSLDGLIQFVEDLIPDGLDKKETVMAVTGKLFDYIVATAFPIWLKPFSGVIKKVIINIIISNAIDFIVGKYNEGAWKMEKNVEVQV